MHRPSSKRRARIIAPAVLVLLALAACSSSAAPPPDAEGAGAGRPVAAPVPQATPAQPGDGIGAADAALIVRTGTLELQVKDITGVVARARDFVASLGGYVAGSEESNQGEKHTAAITYRVPVARWQEAITELRGLADQVLHEATKADEVTAQVVDLNARLQNLQASEASLRDIASRAGTITDVLAVQDKLDQVRDQIERLTAQQQDLTGRASLGTLEAIWETPLVAVTEVRSGWDLGAEIDRAVAQTVGAGQTAASFLVWLLVVGVPVLGPILIVALVVVVLFRRWAARRPPRGPHPGWGPVGPGPMPPSGEAGPAA
jgi:Domain of unknown function (DUF4349)